MDRIVKKTTPAGIDVIFDTRKGDRTVTCGIWVNTGSADDGEHYGMSHLLEHMVFKGTEKRSQLDIVKTVESFGGQINAFTGRSYTCFYVKSLPEFLAKSIEILSDMFSSRRMDEDDLKMEKEVVIEENRMIADQPDEVANEEFVKIMYSGSPHAVGIGGSEERIKAITVDDILSYKIGRYTKDNTVVVVSGACDQDEVMQAVDRGLSGLGGKKDEILWTPVKYRPKFSHIEKDSNATHIMLGGPSVSALDEDKTVVRLLTLVLGGGMSSRLFQKLREEQGLVYTIYAGSHSNSQAGFLEIYTSTAQAKAEKTVREVKKVLQELKQGVSAEEIAMVKKIATSSLMFGSENTRTRMTRIGAGYVVAKELLSEDDEADKINSLKAEDIKRLIDKLISFEDFSGVSVGKGALDWELAWRG